MLLQHLLPLWSSTRFVFSRVFFKEEKAFVSPSTNYFLIIAHPDDESMFFGPLISKIDSCGGTLTIVVCTDGGLGSDPCVRRQEMKRLCEDYNIKVFFLEKPDGFLSAHKEVLHSLEVIYSSTRSTSILTFDEHGVSGHPDHIFCYSLGRSLAKRVGLPCIHALLSVSVLDKYFSPVLPPGSWRRSPESAVVFSTFRESLANRARMFYHRSQLKWYRLLYIVFSCYMDCIILKRIPTQ
ncbi:N-acetylglucosaminylphosphatidylinositol deacetylase [Nematocida major]|uniref:N-acetylglucosaminylphosphatidylinositol deacetylase n=1 Tax=Nematocida major TaxID=1912982 RepID=UPI002007555E|nr:N-acetylglucosaminylphosphatidylinositol deacetylase [Nematocida major]KAH9386771.1 N-acetylglucosaminylphosphatidylinositol deacetylase [Nematocida major]